MTVITGQQAADLFRQAPDRYLDVGEGEVAHRRVGRGPHVLFVHGWPVVTCHVIDLPGAGSSRFTHETTISIDQHIESVRRTLDLLELDSVAVVGHDSGGLIVRHALAGDPRVRAMGLIDTEQSQGLTWRFKQFLLARRLPGFEVALGWLLGAPRLRRSSLVLGGAFADRSLLEGEFEEFFLRPIHQDAGRRDAAVKLLASFDQRYVRVLDEVHQRIDVPVQLVWATFPDARLDIIENARLFSHEERPAEVARALLPALTGNDS